LIRHEIEQQQRSKILIIFDAPERLSDRELTRQSDCTEMQ
jgi:hypothetical protein